MTRPLLHDWVANPGEYTEAEVLRAHVDKLAVVIEAVGPDAATATGLSESTIRAVESGEVVTAGDIAVEAVATVLALDPDAPDAEAILEMARSELLFGMTAAVLNVDVLAGAVDVDLEPREIQGMLEGRHPMNLREYAALQRAIDARSS